MDKEARGKIAQIIRSETKGGYLQDWSDCAISMSEEQQTDYFLILGSLVLKALKKMGYRKLPKGKPPLLNDEEINRAVGEARGCTYINRKLEWGDREIAQAQWDIWDKALYGRSRY